VAVWRRGRVESGFTLLELVVVMALAALLLGLTLPSLYRSWQRNQVRVGLRQLAVTLKTARGQAAAQQQRVRVFLNVPAGKYHLEGSRVWRQLPGMKIVESSLVWQDRDTRAGYIAFYGDGSSSGGSLALVDSFGRGHLLKVEVITGKVSLQMVRQGAV
jgi:general secretion pathway protein H